MTYSSIIRVNDIFDRHPARVNLVYNQFGAAPAAATERFTYTIPAGKQALVQRVQMYMTRVVVTGVNYGLCDMSLYFNGTPVFITLLHNITFAPAGLVASPMSFYTFPPVFMTNFDILFTGERISLTTSWTADAGNTVFFYANVGLIVFDA
jgi:hypothetical protein